MGHVPHQTLYVLAGRGHPVGPRGALIALGALVIVGLVITFAGRK